MTKTIESEGTSASTFPRPRSPDLEASSQAWDAQVHKGVDGERHSQHVRQVPYDNPAGDGVIEIHPIFKDENVVIERQIFSPSQLDQLWFTTSDKPDTIRIRSLAHLHSALHSSVNQPTILKPRRPIELPRLPSLAMRINETVYLIRLAPLQTLMLITQGGDDRIHIDDDVTTHITVRSGDGKDRILSAGHFTRIDTGPGDDLVTILDGNSHVEAGDGDDEVHVHKRSYTFIYGGPGNDILSGDGDTFIDGGDGQDHIIGGEGHNILSGAEDGDRIEAGRGTNVIYTGRGLDDVTRLKAKDTTYYSQNTTLTADCAVMTHADTPQIPAANEFASHIVHSEPGGLLHTGVEVQGSPSFISRVNDDLRLLLCSPTGKRLLAELTRAERKSGRPIIIHELIDRNNSEFIPDPDTAPDALMKGDKPGTPSYGGDIWYNTGVLFKATPSIISLFHELCHAYYYVTGMVESGLSEENYPRSRNRKVSNAEVQATGLPIVPVATTSADADDNSAPSAPPAPFEPPLFSENRLRQELGFPLRQHYNLM
ncbi:M91 family zinc metallopeptidase [Pseudomonas sp. MWU15-20650]|uniref:M91 family zinc metallopeptidase n=1 Tax=Pseudomonas sp. MWU15-20650 TaxID=2933107 RepID=UPI00200D452B|nr:M91 family zinc metallopeptidase [Pseudomonas sp. MWU15-20650]